MFGQAQTATAQTRCSCEHTDWVGDCQARLEVKEKWIKVVSNTQQCSRVDWYLDGQPRLTVVTDGAEMVEYLGSNSSPSFAIQSCKVCKDEQRSAQPQTPPAPGVEVRSELSPQPAKPASPFGGHWMGTSTNPYGITHNGHEIHIEVDGETASGWYSNGGGRFPFGDGVINGDKMTCSIPTDMGGKSKMQLVLTGPDTLRMTARAFVFSFKGDFRRQ